MSKVPVDRRAHRIPVNPSPGSMLVQLIYLFHPIAHFWLLSVSFLYVPRFPSAYFRLYTVDIPAYTTMGSIGHQNDPIQEDLEQLLISAANYSKKQSSDLSSYDARYDLMVKTTRLLQTIRSPADVLFGHFENVSACFSYSILCNANINRLQTSAQSERFSQPVFSMPFLLEARISLLMRSRKRLVWTRTSYVSV